MRETGLALVKGSMPADKDEIVIAENVYQYLGRFTEIEIGQKLELMAEQKSVPVILAGTFDTKKVTNGHGSLAMDSTQIFLSRELARELFPEIENFNYSWNIVSEPKKAQSVEEGLRNVAANHKDISLWTFSESLEYEKMQSRLMFGGMEAVLAAGLPIAAAVSREISKIAFGGTVVPYQFPVLEMGLFLLALFAAEVFLSVWTVRRQKRESLMEQMRALE